MVRKIEGGRSLELGLIKLKVVDLEMPMLEATFLVEAHMTLKQVKG